MCQHSTTKPSTKIPSILLHFLKKGTNWRSKTQNSFALMIITLLASTKHQSMIFNSDHILILYSISSSLEIHETLDWNGDGHLVDRDHRLDVNAVNIVIENSVNHDARNRIQAFNKNVIDWWACKQLFEGLPELISLHILEVIPVWKLSSKYFTVFISEYRHLELMGGRIRSITHEILTRQVAYL